MSEMSCDECPVRTGKKKLAGKRWGLQVPARVCDVEGGAAHLAISYFNGTV